MFALLGNRQSICMSAHYVALKRLNPLSPFSTGSDLCNLLRKLSLFFIFFEGRGGDWVPAVSQ